MRLPRSLDGRAHDDVHHAERDEQRQRFADDAVVGECLMGTVGVRYIMRLVKSTYLETARFISEYLNQTKSVE